jgi:hypothetical protein
LVLLLVGLITTALAQQPLVSAVREEQGAGVRGLTPQEIADLREGRGMGLARAAELNGYPGPRHVLEAAESGQMHLMPDQHAAVKRLFDRMTAEATRLGDEILREERALEAAFRSGPVSEADLRARVARIAWLQGELRLVHLRTHLETRALLDEHQVRRYNELRGHTAGEPGHLQHRH